jgi:uncharacterized protein (DUF1499 family)
MHKFLQVLLLLLLGVLVAALLTTAILGRERLLATVFGPVDLSPIDFRTLTRKPRPNQYLLCPSQYCAATPDAVSPVYAVPAPVLKDRWLTMLARQPRMVPIAVSADGLQYDFLQRSLLLRFPDTITVRFIPLGETQSTLAIYSRSHYGYADFGVNRRRVAAWLEKTGAE